MAGIIEAIIAEIFVLAVSWGFWSSNPILSIILAVVGTILVIKATT